MLDPGIEAGAIEAAVRPKMDAVASAVVSGSLPELQVASADLVLVLDAILPDRN